MRAVLRALVAVLTWPVWALYVAREWVLEHLERESPWRGSADPTRRTHD